MDLCQIKKDFSQMVLQVPQWTLTQFVLWLDLKVAEYKVNGYMILGLFDTCIVTSKLPYDTCPKKV